MYNDINLLHVRLWGKCYEIYLIHISSTSSGVLQAFTPIPCGQLSTSQPQSNNWQ